MTDSPSIKLGRRGLLGGAVTAAVLLSAKPLHESPPVDPRVDRFRHMLINENDYLSIYFDKKKTGEYDQRLQIGGRFSDPEVVQSNRTLFEFGQLVELVLDVGLVGTPPSRFDTLLELKAQLHSPGFYLGVRYESFGGYAKDIPNKTASLLVGYNESLFASAPGAMDESSYMSIIDDKPEKGLSLNDFFSDFTIDACHTGGDVPAMTANYPILRGDPKFMRLFGRDLDLVSDLNQLVRKGLSDGVSNLPNLADDFEANDAARLANRKVAEAEAARVLSVAAIPKAGLGVKLANPVPAQPR